MISGDVRFTQRALYSPRHFEYSKQSHGTENADAKRSVGIERRPNHLKQAPYNDLLEAQSQNIKHPHNK